MLTAFNYYDPEEENRIRRGFKESRFFKREREIAASFSLSHPKEGTARRDCPVCGDVRLSPFFQKWGIQYLRCEKCYSIVADVEEREVKKYGELEELKSLRLSDAYQEEGAKARRQRWKETVDWLRFRAFRYCGRNAGLSVLHYGNRWRGFREILERSGLCGKYLLKDSILPGEAQDTGEDVDLVLSLDAVQQTARPRAVFREFHDRLRPKGLLVLSTKAGSGLDVLLLRGNNGNVFPYEHIMMPSKEGLRILLEEAGLELLEFTTPGTFDINYVKANKEGIAREDFFMRYFMETAAPNAEAEFQRFIQRAGLSSYAQIVARRKDV